MAAAKPIPENAVWFITGCSSGLGLDLSKFIAQTKQYRLVATARRVSTLSYLPDDSANILKLTLDVTSQESISAAVAAAVSKFGRVDVLINNAGYTSFGDAEAITDADARAVFETNFWGAVNMTKEILRVFREVNPAGEGGNIVQVSSLGGYVGFQGNSVYHASKFALEGYTESISKEMYPEWNIKFMIFEPGGIKTQYNTTGMQAVAKHPAYNDPQGPTNKIRAYLESAGVEDKWADPAVVARMLCTTVASNNFPLRLPAGSDAWGMIKVDLEAMSKSLDEWKVLSQSCSGGEQLASVDFLKK